MKLTLPFLLLSLTLVTVSACGPGKLVTPSPEQVGQIISAACMGIEVVVRDVDRSEDTITVAAELNGADMTFIMEAGAEVWELERIEQGTNSYTIEQLHQIVDTMTVMRGISDALEGFREAAGQLPLLDDQVGLQELVPDYYEHAPQASIMDAWDRPLRYRPQGRDYTIISEGPDGSIGTSDDIILIGATFVPAE